MNFRYVTGQSCNSTSRVYLHDDIHDAALAEIVRRVAALKVGLPMRARERGRLPVRASAQFDKTMSYIKLGVEGGARLAYGGKRPADPKLARGLFVEPTVFADVTDDMRIAREEIFGPVVSILRWTDEDDLARARERARLRPHRVDLDARPRPRASPRRRASRRATYGSTARARTTSASRSAASSSRARPRGVDRGAPRLHADQERQRHAASRSR